MNKGTKAERNMVLLRRNKIQYSWTTRDEEMRLERQAEPDHEQL